VDAEVLADAVECIAAGGYPFRRGEGGVLMSGFGDARDAALLLLPAAGLQDLGLTGSVWVWPVTPSEVLVVDADEPAARERACDAVVSRLPVLKPLSLVPLTRVGVLTWAAAADEDLGEVLASLLREQRVADYARSLPALAALAARQGWPAPVGLELEAADGVALAVAPWTEPALIPAEADAVRVGGLRVPLADVRERMELRSDLGLGWLVAPAP
jgi:hypothetical protein